MHPWAFAQKTLRKGAKTTGTGGITPAFPAQWFYGLYALSPVTRLCCHRRRRDAKHHRQLSASLGAPGPHDFAVRDPRHSSDDAPRPSHPAPNVRDDREAPLLWVRDERKE